MDGIGTMGKDLKTLPDSAVCGFCGDNSVNHKDKAFIVDALKDSMAICSECINKSVYACVRNLEGNLDVAKWLKGILKSIEDGLKDQ